MRSARVGAPFFLVSYAEELRESGPGAAELAVPWTVAQVIGQPVAVLPGPVRELLGAAAVVGRVVPHRLLAEVTDGEEGEEQLLAAVEAALAAQRLDRLADHSRARIQHPQSCYAP